MKGRYFAFILAFFCALQLGAQTTPRVLLFADQEYSRLQIKVKGGSYTLTAYTPDSIFAMDYGPDDVHPLYTFRGDLRLNRAGCDSIRITTKDTFIVRGQTGEIVPTCPSSGQRPTERRVGFRPSRNAMRQYAIRQHHLVRH